MKMESHAFCSHHCFTAVSGGVGSAGWGRAECLPAATVAMAPVTEPIERMIEITADPNVDQIDYEAGVVLHGCWASKCEASTQIPTSAKRDSPDSRARGKVVLVNQLAEPGERPVGHRRVHICRNTDPFHHRRAGDCPRPKGATMGGERHRDGSLGPSGNVQPFLINRVEGPLGIAN